MSVIGSLIGGASANDAASNGAAQGQQAMNQLLTQGQNLQSTALGNAAATANPWTTAGTTALGNMATYAGNPNTNSSNTVGAGYNQSPGYSWALNQANMATNNSAAARGGLLSGSNIAAGQANASGLANQDYWQYVTNNQGQNQQQFANNANIAGMGSTTANNLLSQQANAGNVDMSTYGNAGSAAMSGNVSAGNAAAQADTAMGSGISSGLGSLFGI